MTPIRLRRLAFVAALAALISAPVLGAPPAPPPAEAFASLPQVSDVVLSPDGNLIAWGEWAGAQQQVAVFDLRSREFRRHFAIDTSMTLRRIHWSDDAIVLIDVTETWETKGGGGPYAPLLRTLAAEVASGESRILLILGGSKEIVSSANLIAWRTTKPKKVMMATPAIVQYNWGSALFEVDTQSGKGSVTERGTPYTRDWIVNADGDCVARTEWNPTLGVYRILAKRNGGWSEIYSVKGQVTGLYGMTADGSSIAAVGPNAAGRSVLWAIPLDGSGAKVLLEDPTYDVQSVIVDRFSGAPVGVWLGGPNEEARWIDKRAQARFESVARAFKGHSVVVYGRSENGKRLLARVDSPSSPAIYYLVDFNTGHADIAGEEYPALADIPLGEVRSVSFKARDGTAIPAYLTIPPGLDAKNLPLVVLPHGGPEARDDHDFDWLSQFLATRGYAVLRPQFRGSSGFGEAFRLAGRHQWGLLMQDDVSDGVKAMVEQGVADAHRVCIVGASYGGYAALAGAAFTPELYKCAVSISGVSDLPDMLGTVKARGGEESDSLAYWLESIGSPFDKNVIERSPARAAEQIRIPILLLHGINDSVVPVEQSEGMARALAKFNKKYTFVKLDGEDHWLSRGETRLQVLKEIEKFLKENL
jgi:dienelactone hydrolase